MRAASVVVTSLIDRRLCGKTNLRRVITSSLGTKKASPPHISHKLLLRVANHLRNNNIGGGAKKGEVSGWAQKKGNLRMAGESA